MTNPAPAPLRLFVEQLPDEPTPLALPQLTAFCRAFQQATGWQLRCEQAASAPGEVWSTTIDSPRGQSPCRLVLAPAAPEAGPPDGSQRGQPPAIDVHAARPLALAVGNLLSEVARLRHELWQREAELAAGVPVTARPDEGPHLAERLESVLKGGAEAVGCQAAGLYLLDENTSQLKLRAAWNLPEQRLLAAARPLRGAVADLEALVGHAVVLEDTRLLPHWRAPEDFPAAVCVPVASPTMPLGTLWVFSEKNRDFAPEETNLIEIVAGRLAADLEREMLLASGAQIKQQDRQLDVAARWLADRLPSVAPLIDEFEVSGWTRPAKDVGGSFHDWSVLPDSRLALSLGQSHGQLLAAGLGAASLHAAIKSHAGYRHSAVELLARVNDTLLTASPGDQRAALAYAVVDPDTGQAEVALAGKLTALVIQGGEGRLITAAGPLLGEAHEACYRPAALNLSAGDTLLLATPALLRHSTRRGKSNAAASFAAFLAKQPQLTAAGLVEQLRERAEKQVLIEEDLSVLVVRRRTMHA